MKKYLVPGIIGFVLIMISMNGCSSFNNMVTKEETVEKSWGDVQAQYQRRMDLIPNLVKSTEAYANFEKSALTDIINARASASQVKIDPTNIKSIEQYEAAQSQVSSALSRLMVVVEKYPDLKADGQFMSLQAEIAGTENRIAISRKDFNDTVQDYNQYIKRFPKNVWAGAFGFNKKDYFQADAGAKNAPQVSFDIK
jgi:LemA protein